MHSTVCIENLKRMPIDSRRPGGAPRRGGEKVGDKRRAGLRDATKAGSTGRSGSAHVSANAQGSPVQKVKN